LNVYDFICVRSKLLLPFLFFQKDKKLAIAKRDKAKQIDYALKYAGTGDRSSTSLLNVRDKIIKDFRQSTKYKFMETKNMFTKVKIFVSGKQLIL